MNIFDHHYETDTLKRTNHQPILKIDGKTMPTPAKYDLPLSDVDGGSAISESGR